MTATRPTLPTFTELGPERHPFRVEVYRRMHDELNRVAGEAAERFYAGDRTYRAIRDNAVAVQSALSLLWEAVVAQERMETGQD